MSEADVAVRDVLTVDLEEWYHSNLIETPVSSREPSSLHRGAEQILSLLQCHSVLATFFVVGEVAERHPALVRCIAAAGHEVQSHGYAHRLVYQLTPDQFREDIRKAQDAIAQATGQRVVGFRAPSWSIDQRTPWALQILAEEGYEYDASVFPVRTFLFGMSDAPLVPHVVRLPSGGNIVEIPASATLFWRWRVPWGGGFFLRLWPWWVTARLMERAHRRGRCGILYVHLHDIDPDTPRVFGLGLRDAFIQYAFVGRGSRKLECLLQHFQFRTAGELAGLVREHAGCDRPPANDAGQHCRERVGRIAPLKPVSERPRGADVMSARGVWADEDGRRVR